MQLDVSSQFEPSPEADEARVPHPSIFEGWDSAIVARLRFSPTLGPSVVRESSSGQKMSVGIEKHPRHSVCGPPKLRYRLGRQQCIVTIND